MEDNEKQILEQQLSSELATLKTVADSLKAAKAALRQDLTKLATRNLPLLDEQPGGSGQQLADERENVQKNISQSTKDTQERSSDPTSSQTTNKEEIVIQELEPLDLEILY